MHGICSVCSSRVEVREGKLISHQDCPGTCRGSYTEPTRLLNEYGNWSFVRQYSATSRREAVKIARADYLFDKEEYAVRRLTKKEAYSGKAPQYS